MQATISRVIALAKKIAKLETKIITRTVAVSKTKMVKQEPQQQMTTKDSERTNFTLIRQELPLPNKQGDRGKR